MRPSGRKLSRTSSLAAWMLPPGRLLVLAGQGRAGGLDLPAPGQRGVGACVAGEQLIREDAPQGRALRGLRENVIGAVDDVDAAKLAQPLDRRARLHLQPVDPWLPAREHEYGSDPSSGNLFELPAQIVGQSDAKSSCSAAEK